MRRRGWAAAAAATMAALAGCYKLEAGVGDRGFAPETSTAILEENRPPDNRQPDITTQYSMADRAMADALARGQQAGGAAGASAAPQAQPETGQTGVSAGAGAAGASVDVSGGIGNGNGD